MDPAKGSTVPVAEGQLVLVLDDALIQQLRLALRTIPPQIPLDSLSDLSSDFLGFPRISSTGNAAKAKLNAREIGDRIRGRREPLMTIEELATASGVTARTIGSWERGEVTPGRKLSLLCEPLSATLDWLRYGEEPEHGNDRGEDHQG
jgi:DNA-binding XRE family transcriptional regulator